MPRHLLLILLVSLLCMGCKDSFTEPVNSTSLGTANSTAAGVGADTLHVMEGDTVFLWKSSQADTIKVVGPTDTLLADGEYLRYAVGRTRGVKGTGLALEATVFPDSGSVTAGGGRLITAVTRPSVQANDSLYADQAYRALLAEPDSANLLAVERMESQAAADTVSSKALAPLVAGLAIGVDTIAGARYTARNPTPPTALPALRANAQERPSAQGLGGSPAKPPYTPGAQRPITFLYVNGIDNSAQMYTTSMSQIDASIGAALRTPDSSGAKRNVTPSGIYNASRRQRSILACAEQVIAAYRQPPNTAGSIRLLVAVAANRSEWIGRACQEQNSGNSPFVVDLAEAATQWLSLHQSQFFPLPGASPSEVDLIQEAIQSLLDQGRGVVLVGHSQGNLFLHQASQRLAADPQSRYFKHRKCIGYIGTASPVSGVLGAVGTQGYFSAQPSGIFRPSSFKDILSQVVPGSAPANTTSWESNYYQSLAERRYTTYLNQPTLDRNKALGAALAIMPTVWDGVLNIHHPYSYFSDSLLTPRLSAFASGIAGVIDGECYGPPAAMKVRVRDSLLISLPAGDSAAISLQVWDNIGKPYSNPSVAWRTTDSSVAIVRGGFIIMKARIGPARVYAESMDVSDLSSDTLYVIGTARLVKVAGDSQAGAPGGMLKDTLVVRVVDARNLPLSGATVRWVPEAGSGSASTSVDTSDAQGLVKARWTLGTGTGRQTIYAQLGEDDGSQAFTASGNQTVSRLESTPAGSIALTQGLWQPVQAKAYNAQGYRVTAAVFDWLKNTSALMLTASEGDTTSIRGDYSGSQGTITIASGGVAKSIPVTVSPVLVTITASGQGRTPDTLTRGQSRALRAQVYDVNWQPLPRAIVTWSTVSSTHLAISQTSGDSTTVTASGLAYGGGTITATSNMGGSATYGVTAVNAVLKILTEAPAYSPDTLTRTQERALRVAAADHHGQPLVPKPAFTWTTPNQDYLALSRTSGDTVTVRAARSPYGSGQIGVTSAAGGSGTYYLTSVDARVSVSWGRAGTRDTLTRTQTRTLVAAVRDHHGQPLKVPPTVTWATPSQTHLALSRANGDTTVLTASGAAYGAGTITASSSAGGLGYYSIDVLNARVALYPTQTPGGDAIGVGQSRRLWAVVTDHHGDQLTPSPVFVWSRNYACVSLSAGATFETWVTPTQRPCGGVQVSVSTSAGGTGSYVFNVP